MIRVRAIVSLAASAAVLLLAGCAEDVTAILGIDYPYEVYGLLDPTADTQFVRVAPLEERLRPTVAGAVDARVTSTELETGAERAWRDSVLTFADGTRGYVFWSAFRPEGGRSYRIEVTRSDGARSGAVVSVPAPPEVSAPVVDGGVAVPVFIGGQAIRVRRMGVTYEVRYGWCPTDVVEAPFHYHPRVQPAEGGLRVDVALGGDFRDLTRRLRFVHLFDDAFGLVVQRIAVEAVVTNAAWSTPDGLFDPEVLVEPGVLSNVENGFGFVGSGYTWSTTLRVPVDVLAAAGFTPAVPPAPPDPGLCL